jgi:3-dehydroquinate synthase
VTAGAWDLPDLCAAGRPVRFSRHVLEAEPSRLRELAADAGALAVVDDGVALAHPGFVGDLWLLGIPALILPGGRSLRRDGSSHRTRHATAALAAHDGAVLAVGGSALLACADRVAAVDLWMPSSLPGLATAVEALAPRGGQAVLVDLELLRTLEERDWRAGIALALDVALAHDRDFFDWIDRQLGELMHRSLPAMAWVMHRTAALLIAAPSQERTPVPGATRRTWLRGPSTGSATAPPESSSRQE